MEEKELLLEANKWELHHGGLSGRTAAQFINYLSAISDLPWAKYFFSYCNLSICSILIKYDFSYSALSKIIDDRLCATLVIELAAAEDKSPTLAHLLTHT